SFFAPSPSCSEMLVCRQTVIARTSEAASSRPGLAPRLGQASMPDSPPQAIHGLLSAYPGRDAALAIHWCDFGRSNEADVRLSRVLSAGGRGKRAMDGARPSQG